MDISVGLDRDVEELRTRITSLEQQVARLQQKTDAKRIRRAVERITNTFGRYA